MYSQPLVLHFYYRRSCRCLRRISGVLHAVLATAMHAEIASHCEGCTIYGTLRCQWKSRRNQRRAMPRQRIKHSPASASRRSSIKRRAVANQFESGWRRCHIRMTGSESERTSRPSSSAGLLECQRVEPWAREFLKSERTLRTIGLLGSCSMLTQRIEWCCSTVS